MPGLRRRGGNGERHSIAHGVARSHVAYYTKFRGNEITARTKSTAAQSAAEVGPLGQGTVEVGAEVGLFF